MVENAEPMKVEEPTKKAEEKQVDVDGLMAELERAGVTNAEELTGKLRASQESGRLAHLLGDERKQRTELEQRLKELESKPKQQDFMDYPEGQPIDIEAAIERSIARTLDKREKKALEAQQRNLANWNRIQNDEDYHLVKEIWEEKLKDPGFVMQIQTGAKNPIDEYTTTLRKYYKTLLQKTHETITTLQGKDKVKPPHVETSERAPTNMVSEGEDVSVYRKVLDRMHAKVATGYVLTDEEEALAAEATLALGLDAPK